MKKATETKLATSQLILNLRADIIQDLRAMETHTKQPIETLVTKALQMFIATHKDYLGRD